MANIPADAKFSLKSHFDNMAPFYDGYGPVWYQLADQLLAKNPVPITSSSIVHDNGCGNGPVSFTILKHMAPSERPTVHATDLSSNMLQELEKRYLLNDVKTQMMDSGSLTFPDGMFTHSIASMVHPTTLQPDVISKEMFRVVRPGGVVLASQFSSYGWIDFADEAIHKIRPDAPKFTGPVPAEWKTPEWFKGLFVDAGFKPENVEVHETTLRIKFKDMIWEAKDHMCHAIVMMAAGCWSDRESHALWEELMQRFSGKDTDSDGFDHDALLLVARK